MFLISKHGAEAVGALFAEMEDMVIRSLQSVQRTIVQDNHCFELCVLLCRCYIAARCSHVYCHLYIAAVCVLMAIAQVRIRRAD